MKKISFILLLVIASFSALGNQPDTLKVMQYNLLNYGNNYGGCDNTNNNINNKNAYIRTILTAYYPDIFTVCEMGKSTSLPNDFLRNNLNIDGTNIWMASAGANTANSSLTNCIFYNSTKVTLLSHDVANSYTRDVDVYKFRVNSDESGQTKLVCVVAHLKAGSAAANEGTRKIMAENTMRYLEANYRGDNVLIMGDFNLYTATEQAYKTFTNSTTYPDAYFVDPLYPYGVGNWNNNGAFANYHTQSTHRDDNGCHSSGGMDDRFDFILMSESVYGGREHIRYINGSYQALGQDGRHFNQSINQGVNLAVSDEVADALYANSDHLPVIMELAVGGTIGVDELLAGQLQYDVFPNPAKDNVYVRFYQDNIGKANIMLINMLGQISYNRDFVLGSGVDELVIPVDNLPKGFYLLKIANADGLTKTIKMAIE
ncbi:MAG: T9SS type A sorting domain-containing protein [Bacteroidales bacterium]|nr:T9SS type A sorting domain-containing protein [Bacteroidales bacterium]